MWSLKFSLTTIKTSTYKEYIRISKSIIASKFKIFNKIINIYNVVLSKQVRSKN